jgi:imidazolonepropionase
MTGTLAITDARVMTCDPARAGLGMIERGVVVIQDGKVAAVDTTLPAWARGLPTLSTRGRLVTPGLCDAHAHPLFGGTRAHEHALRAKGTTYLEIARQGGGILSTVNATRAASDEDLIASAAQRLDRALAWGTTTCEAKTGYALSVDGELRLLRLYAQLARRHPVTLVPTLLGAHALPPERQPERARYVAECATDMLAGAAGLCHAVDVYCDEGAFTLEESRHILTAAKTAGFAVRAHAGQFRGLGAAGLVAELGGLSADHLEQVTSDEAERMAAAGTVATLLPGACVQLKLPPPPVAILRQAGCAFALGTDLNPGSSFSESLPLQMWLATTHLGLTVEEAWLAVTRHGARAAGRPQAGQLTLGAPGDVVVWDVPEPEMIPYHYGANHVAHVITAGQVRI